MMNSKYQQQRDVRRESRNLAGRFRGGKLAPAMIVPFIGNESGSVSQRATFELDPIPGRMITDVTAELVTVGVPIQAVHAFLFDTLDLPGNDEVIRNALTTGSPLFGLENENEVTKRLGVVPVSVSGVKKVNQVARGAATAAINYLRRRKYVDAVQLTKTFQGVSPAIISQTVLDRLNGVLDPEDRVNGAVQFDGVLKVEGIGKETSVFGDGAKTVTESDGTAPTYASSAYINEQADRKFYVEEDPANPGVPNLRVDLASAGPTISMTDLFQAELMDQLTREMRQYVDKYPEFGQELVSRWARGLSLEVGKQPFVLYERQVTFSNTLERATDGASLGTQNSNLVASIDFTVPVPKTEFGMMVVTFLSVKPDETLASQPHPILSKGWTSPNFVADEMAIDPVPVTIRDLDADCDTADENTVALYVGNNHLMKTYVNYGFNRHVDETTVENKTALWQLEVPMSVTPETVLYPANLSHYPFADQNAEVCTYTISSTAVINTPVIFGPVPVEELAEIENADVFEDA